jgi:hypothetical protein
MTCYYLNIASINLFRTMLFYAYKKYLSSTMRMMRKIILQFALSLRHKVMFTEN